jgi:ribosome biogenesis GTPase / thiamine phosphate phosphatase
LSDLHTLGWDPAWEDTFAPHAARGLSPGRVVDEVRNGCRVSLDGGTPRLATLAGKLRHLAAGPEDLPAVGDWVALQGDDRSGTGLVVAAVLPRRSRFARAAVGGRTSAQVLAANVDAALLVAGLDGDLNARRLERYLAAAWDSGATPAIVLTKADLCPDPVAAVAEVAERHPGVEVQAVSAPEGRGLEGLARLLSPGRTAVLLGSSGAGKSTLLNALLGGEVQDTGEVRASDGRGKHTTTRRQLFALPSGAMLIDTPGLRELALWGVDEASLEATFEDVDALAAACRFRDCAHQAEPGCAVQVAIASGELEAGRLDGYQKLQREARRQRARQDTRARIDEKQRLKTLFKGYRERTKARQRERGGPR